MPDDASDNDDLLSIGRFASRSALSVAQLRHYHELGLLLPEVVDQETGYRYYRERQVGVAAVIAALRAVDTPIADIRRVLECPERQVIAQVLARQRQRLDARLIQVRGQLRALANVTVEDWLMSSAGERRMVEVTISSVMARRINQELWRRIRMPDESDTPADVADGSAHPDSYVLPGSDLGFEHWVLLAEIDGDRTLPIWIGIAEANALGMARMGRRPERPLTYELASAMLEGFGAVVKRAEITHLESDVYFATVTVGDGERETGFDARPSDALNFALRANAPAFVDEALLSGATTTPPVRVVELVDEQTGNSVARLQAAAPPPAGRRIRLLGRLAPEQTRAVTGRTQGGAPAPSTSQMLGHRVISEWEVREVQERSRDNESDTAEPAEPSETSRPSSMWRAAVRPVTTPTAPGK